MSDFKGRHFEGEIVLWAVRWYCRYEVGYRDLEQTTGERGVSVDHSTIYRWWFEAEPWRTARELLERLQDEQPGIYPVGLLRTLQRRLKIWRRDKAHEFVFGATPAEVAPVPVPLHSLT